MWIKSVDIRAYIKARANLGHSAINVYDIGNIRIQFELDVYNWQKCQTFTKPTLHGYHKGQFDVCFWRVYNVSFVKICTEEELQNYWKCFINLTVFVYLILCLGFIILHQVAGVTIFLGVGGGEQPCIANRFTSVKNVMYVIVSNATGTVKKFLFLEIAFSELSITEV